MSELRRQLPTLIAAAVVLAAPMSGLFVVDHGSVAVVHRFGAVNRVAGPGLQIRLPWPLESHERVAVSEVRRVESGKVRLLTGDTNLVDVELVAQYTIADPVAWTVNLTDPEALIAAELGAVSSTVVARMQVDGLLTTGRAELQRQVQLGAQALLDQVGAGVLLSSVEVQSLSPPPAVLDAFNDVSSARGDRETLALAAESAASQRLPQVRGEAAASLEAARGAASARLAQAAGDVDRFQALAEADRASSAATRARIWSDTLRQVGARVDLKVAAPGTVLQIDPSPAAAESAPEEKRP